MRRYRRVMWAGLALVLLMVLILLVVAIPTFQTWTILAPDTAGEAATVIVADYGHHARLALPDPSGELLIEYSFGDWRYYALNERGFVPAARALLASPQATIARRKLPFTDDEETYNRHAHSVRSVQIELERERADTLRIELDRRWSGAGDEERNFLQTGDMIFAADDRRYHLFRNSNREVANWLEKAGCEVDGTPILSNFIVVEEDSTD